MEIEVFQGRQIGQTVRQDEVILIFFDEVHNSQGYRKPLPWKHIVYRLYRPFDDYIWKTVDSHTRSRILIFGCICGQNDPIRWKMWFEFSKHKFDDSRVQISLLEIQFVSSDDEMLAFISTYRNHNQDDSVQGQIF